MPADAVVRTVPLELRNNLQKFFTMKDATEIMLDGPAGCVSGDTLIDTIDMGAITIAELQRRGIAPIVLTMIGAVKAHVPFIKGIAPIYRVTTNNGHCVSVTEDHLFYTSRGWAKLKSMDVGSPILSSYEYSEDVLRSLRIAPGSLGGYLPSCRSYDELPPSGLSNDLSAFQSLSDAHGHTHGYSPVDDLVGVLADIQTYLQLFQTTKLDYYAQFVQTLLAEYCYASGNPERAYEKSQQSLLFPLMACQSQLALLQAADLGYTRPCTSSGVVDSVSSVGALSAALNNPHDLRSPGLVSSLHTAVESLIFDRRLGVLCLSLDNLNYHYTVQWDKVVNIEHIGDAPYYDIHVPDVNHYRSQGLWHHNTGKTRVALERQHLISTMYPNSRGLIVRKYRSSMNETCLQVLDKEVYADRDGKPYQDAPHWAERDQKYIYDNGTEIIVAGMDDPTKVMSSQYDWFYWNEAIEGQESEWEMVMSRLRNGRIPYQQAIGDTNPGPPQHWILSREKAGRLLRLPTTHKDNPVYWDDRKGKWTVKGKAYVVNILANGLTGVTRDRLYDGRWVSAEGLVYPQWDTNVHVIPRKVLPRHWPHYWIFDFGFVDPFVWVELTEDPDTGELYLTRELYHTGLRVDEAAGMISEANKGTGIYPYALICDHDAEDRATLEKGLGMMTVPAFKPINIGIGYVQNRLRVDNPRFPKRRGLYVMHDVNIKTDPSLKTRHKPTCTEEEFALYQWDTGKIALDKYKDAPIDKNNHGMDSVRYGVCFVDDASLDPQEFTRYEAYNDIGDEDEYEDYETDGSISIY